MEDRLLSTLYNKLFISIGFTFKKHPVPGKFLQISVYREDKGKNYILCFSEGKGTGNTDLAKKNLGKLSLGNLLAPFAKRGIEGGATLEQVKQVMEDGESTWYWYK